MENQINDLWTAYRSTGSGMEKLFRRISLHVYSYPKNHRFCSEEDCADFFISFYPRITRIISRYKETGKSFEAYLHSCLRWHMRSYLKTRGKEARQNNLLLQEEYFFRDRLGSAGDEVREEALPWNGEERKIGPFRFRPDGTISRPGNRKQLILIALKSSLDIGDSAIAHLAILTGLHQEVLFHIISVLRFCMRQKIERINTLQERRNRNYFRIRCLVEEQSRCACETNKKALERRIDRERKRWETTSAELSRVPRSPSHGDIARLLGLPKGSVDSGCFYLKKYL